jgi:integrase
MRLTFTTLAISAAENIDWGARMLGHKRAVVTLERCTRFVPNLTRLDGQALMGTVQKSETFRYSFKNHTVI